MPRHVVLALCTFASLFSNGCARGAGEPTSDRDDAGPPAVGADSGEPDAPDPVPCAADCAPEEVCVEGTCVASFGPCASDADCTNDTWCATGGCVPWGTRGRGETSPDCVRTPDPGPFAPALQCSWSTPPDGDATPEYDQVMSTPVVADLGVGPAPDPDSPTFHPSIVFSTFRGEQYNFDGVLRIIDGATCEHVQSLNDDPADRTIPAASATLADLDADGHVEILAPASDGGVLAFAYDEVTRRYVRSWRSRDCATGTQDDSRAGPWAGVSVHDLDDDGRPEVIYGAIVYDASGCILDSAMGFRSYESGQIPILADVDQDGEVEWVSGSELLRFDVATRSLQAEAGFQGAGLSDGFVAVADFGEFPGTASETPGLAEIVVVADGYARIQTIAGEVVFGPLTIEGLATGGPPTVGDFDGDGQPEFASAGGDRYVVFDLDCDREPLPASCAARGVLWSQPSVDHSSNMTGSSVFDFEGDGAAEAVYADECFLRIYDGSTGAVKFSQGRSSATTYENPVIADVDGDFNSEIVTSTNDFAGRVDCALEDPLFPGAAYELTHGVRVYRDVEDRWVGSRAIWNQHAYSVTNVTDRGGVPRTSAWVANWLAPGLDNFRQNVQGSAVENPAPDLTAHGEGFEAQACGDDPRIVLRATVCNRGTEPVGAGVDASFEDASPDAAAGPLCQTHTVGVLAPGHCEPIECTWSPATMDPVDVRVVVDGAEANRECLETNNVGQIPDVGCEALQ